MLAQCQSYATIPNSHIDRFRFCCSVVLYSGNLLLILCAMIEQHWEPACWTPCSLFCCLTTKRATIVELWKQWRLHLRKIFSTDHLLERKTGALVIVLTTSAFLTTLAWSRVPFGNISQNAARNTELQSYGITNLENVKENGDNFSTRHIPLSSLLELIHLLDVFYLHRIKQVPWQDWG